jgi:hypothetical protein
MDEPVKCPACHRYTTPVCAYCGVCLESSADDKLLDEAEKALADIESQDNDDHEVYLDLTEIARLITRIRERKAGK